MTIASMAPMTTRPERDPDNKIPKRLRAVMMKKQDPSAPGDGFSQKGRGKQEKHEGDDTQVIGVLDRGDEKLALDRHIRDQGVGILPQKIAHGPEDRQDQGRHEPGAVLFLKELILHGKIKHQKIKIKQAVAQGVHGGLRPYGGQKGPQGDSD